MFEHSVKVPRYFKIAANIFKKVSTEGGSIKTLLYDDKLRHFRTNALYALLTQTIKHAASIEKIFQNCSLLANEPRLDPWLAKILTAELLFGKKALPGKSKPEQTILSYKELFEKYISDHQDDLKTQDIRRPRYVRINTNLLTTSDAIRAFQDEGYRFIRCTAGTYEDYLNQIQGIEEYDFTQDYHVKTIFVFAPGTKLHEHDLYLENKIILQDKATALAVHLLAPPPGSVALDMCAAPGMKTTQLAAYMKNEGKIYAVERNEKRYQTLCEFVNRTGSKCVETLHKDSLEIKRGDCDDVEYILLDPSCSGSGMELSVHNYIDNTRLAKLTSLQEKFLKHAMNSFPNAKRIVYSTCSLFPEENERVITNIVKNSRAKWRVQDIKELLKGQWNNFGSSMYGSMGAKCMYAKPDIDFTTGFFLAVLDRDLKEDKTLKHSDNRKVANEQVVQVDGFVDRNEPKVKDKKNDKQKPEEFVNEEETSEENTLVKKEKKHNKNKKKYLPVEDAAETNEISNKKKKHKLEDDNSKSCVMESLVVPENIDTEDRPRKNKKRKVDADENDTLLTEEVSGNTLPKRKLKNSEEMEEEELIENVNVVIDEVPTKKKKKKREKATYVEV